MRSHLLRVATVALGAGGLLLACTVNSTTVETPGNDGGTTTNDDASTTNDQDDGSADVSTTPVDSGMGTTDASPEAATPEAFVRLAHWSPDAPAVDVCFTTQGGSFSAETPQLATLVATSDGGVAVDGGDGGAVGLLYRQVTAYLIIAPGTYSVRLVAAGSADCNTSIADLASVTLSDATYTTVAAVGEATPVQSDQALKLVSFADDVTAPSGQIAIRFINASPEFLSVDLGTGSLANGGTPFAPLFTGVAFGTAGSAAGTDAGTVDANGYLASNPFAGAMLSAHVTSSAADTVTAASVTVSAPSAATLAIIGGVTGNPMAPPQLLQCADVDDSTSTNLLAQCSVISP
jgi:hypothetical protein